MLVAVDSATIEAIGMATLVPVLIAGCNFLRQWLNVATQRVVNATEEQTTELVSRLDRNERVLYAVANKVDHNDSTLKEVIEMVARHDELLGDLKVSVNGAAEGTQTLVDAMPTILDQD